MSRLSRKCGGLDVYGPPRSVTGIAFIMVVTISNMNDYIRDLGGLYDVNTIHYHHHLSLLSWFDYGQVDFKCLQDYSCSVITGAIIITIIIIIVFRPILTSQERHIYKTKNYFAH
jgi:hypothetical protein